ncbi:AlbA family DNA-binding domain-containing protein [Pseudomonas protegens]|uniref:AlbA family DNA-binding domain-containing protein n=1 Tax=Pseudomonas protegens TaxID=380021 RepID=UPI0024C421D8|nr:ATP-binding protein [Pseudomonas protegens]MDK1394666.1 ATP-binding protein [Pseudomonas protegens]
MNDRELIERLLYRGEGSALDYKMQQYPFSGAEEIQKSELLKDILAFANAWRSEVAYILIGVKNDTGELVGLDVDIDDSRLQEFVNSKTNHPVDFSYRSVEYDGVKLGLYTIQIQERPVFIRKKYGRVDLNTVYVRRGSATAIADPSEIAKMGAASVAKGIAHSPKFNVKVVCAGSAKSDVLSVSYTRLELLPLREYPDCTGVESLRLFPSVADSMTNRGYYRDLAKYVQESCGRVPFVIEVNNSGGQVADDVKVLISLPVAPLFSVKGSWELLVKPEKIYTVLRNHRIPPPTWNNGELKCVINRSSEEFFIQFNIGKLQTGESRRTPQVFMVNPPSTLNMLTGRILSDQLTSPVEFNIPVSIEVSSEVLTVDKLKEVKV